MPEGPDVCVIAHFLLSKLKNRLISNLIILNEKVKLKNPELFKSKYIIQDIKSKGKLLWFELIEPDTNVQLYITIHFMLNGYMSFHKSKLSKLKFKISNQQNTKTYNLYYNESMNIGTIEFTHELNEKITKQKMDFLQDTYTLDEFTKSIANCKDIILGKILMEQEKGIGSGIGNYLLAEILYIAKLSPNRKLSSLSADDIASLYESIRYTIKLAYYNNPSGYASKYDDYVELHRQNVDADKYPIYHPEIKFNSNDIFELKIYKKYKDPLNNDIMFDETINSGRITYWVPKVQI